MRNLLVRASVALLSATLVSIASAGHEESWLPAEPGWKWTYDVNKVARVVGIVKVKKQGTVTCACTGVEKVDGKDYAVLEWSGTADERYDVKVVVRGEGGEVLVARVSHRNELLVVPADLEKKKRRVEVKGDDGEVTVDSTTSTSEEELETPAGKFKCLRVDAELTITGNIVARRSVWYAKGTGVVKVLKTTTVGGGVQAERELVLTRVEKGK